MKVLIFASEDRPYAILELFALEGGDDSNLAIQHISEMDEVNIVGDEYENIVATIQKEQASLVIFDAINSFSDGNISTDQKARRTVSTPLQRMANQTGAAIIGIRNWGKSAEGSVGSQKAMGATSVSSVSRAEMNTVEILRNDEDKRKGKPREFWLIFEKVTGAPPQKPLKYRAEDRSTEGDELTSHLRTIEWDGEIDRVRLMRLGVKGFEKYVDGDGNFDSARWLANLKRKREAKRQSPTGLAEGSGSSLGIDKRASETSPNRPR